MNFGNVLWTVEEVVGDVGGPIMFGTPVADQGNVFVEAYRDTGLTMFPPAMYYKLYALDAGSGETIWTYEKIMPGFETRHSPLLSRDRVVIGNLGELIALDSSNGSVLWTFTASQQFLCYFGSAVSESDIIAVSCNYGWDTSQPSRLFVLSSETGKEIWNTTFCNHIVVPTIDDSSIYVSDFEGHVSSFDFDGNELWSIPFSERIDSPLTLDGEYIYFGSESGTAYVVRKSSGDVVWKSSGFDEIHSSFAVSPDSFYFVTYEGTLYAFDKKDRSEVWNISLDGCTLSSPVVGRNALILPSGKYIYFIEPRTGKILWEYDFTTGTSLSPDCVSSTVSISKDIVVFPTTAGYVFSLDPMHVGRIYAFTANISANNPNNPGFDLQITVLLLTMGTAAVATAASVALYWRRLKT